jgi:hypothetical protein
MLIRKNILYTILLLFFFCKPLQAIETNIVQNDEVTVRYEKSLKTVAKEIIKIYPSVKLELEKTFESEIEFKPTVILMKDRKAFQRMAVIGRIVAVAVPQKNLIVIDNSKMKTHPFTLGTTLKHELCHLLLHHYVQGDRLPKWLNEGISQWVTGGVSELIMEENKDLLKQATISGRFIPIEYLTDQFPGDERSLLLAYQESKGIMEYIVSKFGHNGMVQILNHLRDGDEINVAVKEALTISIEELENNWHNHLRAKYTWFTYLSSNLYQVIFSLAAAVLIYGFVKLLIRKRAYKDEEDEDEDEDAIN